jgi:hypothetical protein
MYLNNDRVKKDQSIIVDFFFDSTHFFCPEKSGPQSQVKNNGYAILKMMKIHNRIF